MKSVDRGRYGPWEPMQGARGRAEAIQQEASVAQSADRNSANYRKAIRNPSHVKPESIRRSRNAARRGLVKGSSPNTPDESSPF
jgi:hypothetical protein